MDQNFNKPKFLVFPTRENANKYVSDLIVKQIGANPHSNLAFSTYDSCLSIFKLLIDANTSNLISFENVSTFNFDEYLGLGEKDYNKSHHFYMDQNLFDHININKDNTFFPVPFGYDYNQNPEYDFVEYDRFIQSKGFVDILLTSIGNDGSLGFNQVNSNFESFTGLVQFDDNLVNSLVKEFGHKSLVPTHAITMGIQSILYSKKIVLVAFGAEKAEALYNLFFNNDFDPNWPLTALNYHQDVVVVCDKDAATYIMDRKIQ